MTDRAFSPLDAWKPLAGRALETALNRVLALDPDTRSALAGLDGRRIALTLEAPPLALEITVSDGGLRVGPARHEPEPDLAVRSSLGGLIAQLPFLRSDEAPPVGRLRLSGDAELARRLQRLAERFDPDWERPFVDVFGAILGPQLARAVRATLRAGREGARRFARDTADYLTEESRAVVGKAELAAFHDDVDDLRDRAERLAARVARLRQHGAGA